MQIAGTKVVILFVNQMEMPLKKLIGLYLDRQFLFIPVAIPASRSFLFAINSPSYSFGSSRLQLLFAPDSNTYLL